ncbi:hypothetical protein [Embleya sp. AB8]|uniref:hypothetical protein n=1 Tax=Embleya sp. AB8 TaxID=3156304 RepID=UPI003C785936
MKQNHNHNQNHKRIDHILGAVRAGELLNAWIDALMADDHLSRAAATRVACERLTAGSPWLIAAPGQTWRLRDEFEPAVGFAPRLARVVAFRRAQGAHPRDGTAAVLIADAEHAPEDPIGWIDIDDFATCYTIEAWPEPEPS